MSKIPNFIWAENGAELWVTVDVPNAKGATVEIKESSLAFNYNGENKDGAFAVVLPLNKKVDPAKSTYAIKDRGVEIRLVKPDDAQGYWLKLSSDNKFKAFCKADWDLWTDEEDEADKLKKPANDFGMGGMGGMEGFDGMGDEADGEEGEGEAGAGPDSDDEAAPGLEAAAPAEEAAKPADS